MSKIPVDVSGLTPAQKRAVVKRLLRERVSWATDGLRSGARSLATEGKVRSSADAVEEFYKFDTSDQARAARLIKEIGKGIGISNPYYKAHDGNARGTTSIDGKECITFANYNYLGLSGHPTVSKAAKAAIDRYGTSVSASRIVSGQRPLHGELEARIARALGVDDSIVMIAGFTTNVTVIGHLFGPKDVIIHDELSHNSLLQGAILSGARRFSFPHSDWKALDKILGDIREDYAQALIVVEGMYSMDGDFPDPRPLIEIKKRHHALLMIDEAHSLGVLGEHGYGLGEHYGVDRDDVDIWMGTLSKTFASCGGYIAGRGSLIEYLRYTAPGAVYSVGLTPPDTAAALAAFDVMEAEPERIAKLHENGRLFMQLAKEAGLDIGYSMGVNIVPVIVGSSPQSVVLSNMLLDQGINVQPIVYPAVEERSARLRFFLSCEHTEEQIRSAVDLTGSILHRLRKS